MSSSFNKKATCRPPRNEENQYQRKNEENKYWQRLQEQSNQRTLKVDLPYLLRSWPKDTNATEIKNLTTQTRIIQEVGGLPTPVILGGKLVL